jgi:polysaccharide export outer membrane protein
MSKGLLAGIRNILLLGLILGITVACSGPRGAAISSEILKQDKNTHPEFAVYQVSRNTLPQIAKWPGDPKANRHWLSHSHKRSLNAHHR